MSRLTNEWARGDAEKFAGDIYDAAEAGVPQRILTANSVLEVRLLKKRGEKAGEFLSRGHPIDD